MFQSKKPWLAMAMLVFAGGADARTVSGRIIAQETGAPLAAHVRLFTWACVDFGCYETLLAEADTDAQGAFALDDANGTGGHLVATSPGRVDGAFGQPMCIDWFCLGDAIPAGQVALALGDIALTRAVTFSGSVTLDGVPSAAGVFALYDDSNGQPVTKSVTSDATGHYTLSGVPPVPLRLGAQTSAGELTRWHPDIDADELSDLPPYEPAPAPGSTFEIDFATHRGSKIVGLVTNARSNAPISTSVHVRRAGGSDSAWHDYALTGSGGRYHLGPFVAGRQLELLFGAPGTLSFDAELYDERPCLSWSCVDVQATTITMPASGEVTIDESLTPRLRVHGRVLDRTTNLPIAGVRVGATRGRPVTGAFEYRQMQVTVETITDQNGEYELSGMSGLEGDTVRTIGAPGYADRAIADVACVQANDFCNADDAPVQKLDFTGGAIVEAADLRLDRGVVIEGRVFQQALFRNRVLLLDADGRMQAVAETEPDGSYRFEGFPAEPFRLVAIRDVAIEVHGGIDCADSSACDYNSGTLFAPDAGDVLSGLDFTRGERLFEHGFE